MFTPGELAAMTIIGSEIRQNGVCTLSQDEIAARAGVSYKTVQRAIRAAGFAGIMTKEERPRRAQKSLTNILRCVSREWAAWLKRGPRRQAGTDRVTNATTHGQQGFRQESSRVETARFGPINSAPAGSGHAATGGA
jgi:hypothetical protein